MSTKHIMIEFLGILQQLLRFCYLFTSCFCLHTSFMYVLKNEKLIKNVPQSCLKVIAKCSSAYILCLFPTVRTVSVAIGRIYLGRTFFTNFRSNIWRILQKNSFSFKQKSNVKLNLHRMRLLLNRKQVHVY